jgi:hypothetical protein
VSKAFLTVDRNVAIELDASVMRWLRIWDLGSFGSLRVNDPFLGALCPSKSGLMNKHIVQHIVS